MEFKKYAVDISMILFSYLLGCLNTGYYYVRFFYKKDIREIGTNVTGAVNVSRLTGKKGFIITFIGDSLKGIIAVSLCRYLIINDSTTLLCIFFVAAGHIFPFQLKFKGGKGLATGFGAFLAYDPRLIIFIALTYFVLYWLVKESTVTLLFSILFLPLEIYIAGYGWKIIVTIIFCDMMAVYAGRRNLSEYKNKIVGRKN